MKKIEKLALHRETVRTLTRRESGMAAGGSVVFVTAASCFNCPPHLTRPFISNACPII